MFKLTFSLALGATTLAFPLAQLSKRSLAECDDIQTGCQTNWCGNDYWKSQCLKTCSACAGAYTQTDSPTSNTPSTTDSPTSNTPSTTDSPTSSTSTDAPIPSSSSSSSCQDIEPACQASWCESDYWRSQCLNTCNACEEVGEATDAPTPAGSSPSTGAPTSPSTGAPTSPSAGAPISTETLPSTKAPTSFSSGSSSSMRCGMGWTDANGKCGSTCIDDGDCPQGESCFADLATQPCDGGSAGGALTPSPAAQPSDDKCTNLAGHTSNNHNMMAFMENWKECPSDAQLAHYTHVVVSFAVTYTWAPEGNKCSDTCEYQVGSTPACTGTSLKAFVERAHKLGVKVLVSLGGAGMGGSWDLSVNRCWDPCLDRVNELAAAVVEEVKQSGADGIDFDYEFIYEQRYVDFIEEWTTLTRAGLDALGEGKLLTMAPMSSDLDQGDEYFNLLSKINSHVDFMMPQYYNGFLSVPQAVTDSTEWERVKTHYRNLAVAMGGEHKLVFGFCNGDCIAGHNIAADQALTIAQRLDESFPMNAGSYFWAASMDTTQATWSQPLADYYCEA